MRKVFGLVVVAFALSVGVSVAFAHNSPSAPGCSATNCSTQAASLGQVGSATAGASNSGSNEHSKTQATAVSSNDAEIDQHAGQFTDGGSNASTQTAGLLQVAVSNAQASQKDGEDDNSVAAKAIADNDASIYQGALQLSFWHTSNSSNQSVAGTQVANAAATASNMGGDDQGSHHKPGVSAFAGSFNDGWICQSVFQLAFP